MFDFDAAAFDGGVIADAVWGACMALMVFSSLTTFRRVERTAAVPLQWGRDGAPVLRAQRSLAVAFTPMAAAVGGLMLAAVERMSGGGGDLWLATRLLAPVVLVVVHRAHMSSALVTLKGEGGLKG